MSRTTASRSAGGGAAPAALSLAAALLVLVTGCAVSPPLPTEETVVWQGQVRVTDDVIIPRGTRLMIEPGTVVRFAFRDDDGDGWGDAVLRVQGTLVARGTAEAPVVFTSDAQPAQPGLWGGVRVDFGEIDLRYTVVEGSSRGLHVHFSRGRISDSVLRRNIDGTRLGQDVITVEHSLFYGHPGKGLNQRLSQNRVELNRFHHNRNGLFLFEGDRGSVFRGNAFRANDHPFRLGDFFTGTVQVEASDWGGSPPCEVGSASDRPDAQLVEVPGEIGPAGPRQWPWWEPAGASPEYPGGDPAAATGQSGDLVLDAVRLRVAPSNGIQAMAGEPGRKLWRRSLGAPVVAGPVVAGPGLLAVATRTGRLYLLDVRTGLERDAWEFGEGAVAGLAPAEEGGVVIALAGGGVQVLRVRVLPRESAP